MDELDLKSADSPLAPVRDAAVWLARGQALEAESTPASLAEALRSYDCAIALLRPAAKPAIVRRDLAVAYMNRGNALQKMLTVESLAESVRAYDETIALLSAPEFRAHPPSINTLGAAHMNRGHAFHRQGTPPALSAAVASHRQAVAVLTQLPLTPDDANPAEEVINRRLNLAGAWVNIANVLLGDAAAENRYIHARASALQAFTTLAPDDLAYQHTVAAELALLAHRAHCDSLGQLIYLADPATSAALASEASDSIDAAFALLRHAERHGMRHFRPIGTRLFHFGAQLYRLNQPHFLSEFILEQLDPERSPGAVADDPVLYAIAEEAIANTLRALQGNTAVFDASTPAAQRQLETRRDLKSATARLAELRAKHLPAITA